MRLRLVSGFLTKFERERNPRNYDEPSETGSFFRGGGRTY
jgi:hypothetical protein